MKELLPHLGVLLLLLLPTSAQQLQTINALESNEEPIPHQDAHSLLLSQLQQPLPDPSTLNWDNSTTVINRELTRLLQALTPFQHDIRQYFTSPRDSSPVITASLTCNLCTAVLPILSLFSKYLLNSVAKLIAVQACTILKLAPRDDICKPIINSYADQFMFILRNQPVGHKGSELCGVISPDCADSHPELVGWSVRVKGGKPGRREAAPASPEKPNYTTFLQFTDIHLDLDYMKGTNPECTPGVPICCRFEEGRPAEGVRAAGKYGDMNCALPDTAFKASLEDAKTRYPSAKYIFLTGDYIHSGVWLYNQTENQRHVSHVVKAVSNAFATTSAKVYPITGNHEPHVVNMYVPPELWNRPEGNGTLNMGWLYSTVLEPFITRDPNLLPVEEVNRFLQWGYYSVVPETGLRLVFLNTNLGYGENFWLAYFAKDPGGQLAWLSTVLEAAENNNQAVYIIGHVEPGDTFGHWSSEFNRILSRFEGVIRGMFYGHSHKPQYRVHFLNGTVEPAIPVSIIAGSLLTDGMNPAYSAYRVDGESGSWDLMRHELVALRLDESNRVWEEGQGGAVFEKVVDSWEDFGLGDFRGGSVLGLGNRMVCDQGLLDKYLRFHHKGNDSFSHKPCSIEDLSCKLPLLSDFADSNAADSRGLEEFRKYIKYTDCNGTKGLWEGSGGDNVGPGSAVSVVAAMLCVIVGVVRG